MVDNFWGSLAEVAKLNSFRRSLWVFLGIATLLLIVESQTQFLEYYSLNQQADLLAKVSSDVSTSNASQEIEQMQLEILQDIKDVKEKREKPVSSLIEYFMRFLMGAWILFPLVYFGGGFLKNAVIKAPAGQKKMAVWLALMGFSSLAWFTTVLGFVSILFNRGNGFFVSWFIFPIGSLMMVLLVMCWFALLKAVVPEMKKNS